MTQWTNAFGGAGLIHGMMIGLDSDAFFLLRANGPEDPRSSACDAPG